MNKKAFYLAIRGSLFPTVLKQGIVDTIEAILNECDNVCINDYRYRAYILGTAYGESYSTQYNPEWLPVREGFAKTNQGAIRHVTALYNNGRIETNYSLPQPNKQSYYGRGYVQITWPDNYKRVGKLIDEDLYNNPDLALNKTVAAKILVNGMLGGWFTKVSLDDFIRPDLTDFINARRIVNGKDRANGFSIFSMKFYNAMIKI